MLEIAEAPPGSAGGMLEIAEAPPGSAGGMLIYSRCASIVLNGQLLEASGITVHPASSRGAFKLRGCIAWDAGPARSFDVAVLLVSVSFDRLFGLVRLVPRLQMFIISTSIGENDGFRVIRGKTDPPTKGQDKCGDTKLQIREMWRPKVA